MSEKKDREIKVRAGDRLVTDLRTAAEADGLNVSELVRQALQRELAERGRREVSRLGRALKDGRQIPETFAKQEAPARDFAAGGSWLGRMWLGSTLMGLGGVYASRNPALAAEQYEEARGLFAGCVVDAPDAKLCKLASQRAEAAAAQRDVVRGLKAKGTLAPLILPAGFFDPDPVVFPDKEGVA